MRDYENNSETTSRGLLKARRLLLGREAVVLPGLCLCLHYVTNSTRFQRLVELTDV